MKWRNKNHILWSYKGSWFQEAYFTPPSEFSRGIHQGVQGSQSCKGMTSYQQYMRLTDMTLYPRLDRVRTCLKNTSAVPLAGGKQISGQRTPRGPASYINHSLSSELSTTICSMHNKWKNGDMFILRTQPAEIENLTVETFMRLAKHNLLASQSG